MSTASRCNEIIRLIDEVLDDRPATSIEEPAGRGKADRECNEEEAWRADRMAG